MEIKQKIIQILEKKEIEEDLFVNWNNLDLEIVEIIYEEAQKEILKELLANPYPNTKGTLKRIYEELNKG